MKSIFASHPLRALFGAWHDPRRRLLILFGLEGLLLFAILWWFARKPRPRMAVTGVFLLGYGCFRFFAEFFRQPDAFLGFVAFGWMTMGQVLSAPMIVGGMLLLALAYGYGWREWRRTD